MFRLSFHFILSLVFPSCVLVLPQCVLAVTGDKMQGKALLGLLEVSWTLGSSSSEQCASGALEKGRIVQYSYVCIFWAVARTLKVKKSCWLSLPTDSLDKCTSVPGSSVKTSARDILEGKLENPVLSYWTSTSVLQVKNLCQNFHRSALLYS